MPNKTEEYLALAQRTANGLTRYWEHWTDYLTTASRLYKYNFADQLMIYAQRPDATACASFDIWNNRMNRYVRRGSKGIALLDQSSSVPRLHYVFDVSDTGVRRNSRDPEVWQLNDDLFKPVSEMLAREYGIHHERLSQQIADIAGKLAESYWDNNSSDILAIVDGTFLMDYDEAGQELQFKSAAAISIMYTILERCGFEPEDYFDRDDFQAIYDFSTPDAVYALGTAVSDCSRDVLRNIERTVKTTIRRRNVERSQHEYEEQERDLLDRRGFARWAKRHNLKEISKTLIFLQEHKISSVEEVRNCADKAGARYHELGDSIKVTEKRMAEIAVLRTHIVNYTKTREVYTAYRKAGYSKKILESHREEITLHKAAKAAFDESGLKKLPRVKDLNEEYTRLLAEKKAAYPDYRKAKEEMQEWAKAKKNMELFFAEETRPKEQTKAR